MTRRIVSLAEAPEHASQITDWLFAAFGEGSCRAFFASIVQSSLQGAEFPVTFVALEGDKAVGTVGFWRCDLISRQDLYPWLAALYVEQDARGQGWSEALQQHVIRYAEAQGFERLWLWATFADYYERFGWRYYADALEYPDIPVRVYQRRLGRA